MLLARARVHQCGAIDAQAHIGGRSSHAGAATHFGGDAVGDSQAPDWLRDPVFGHEEGGCTVFSPPQRTLYASVPSARPLAQLGGLALQQPGARLLVVLLAVVGSQQGDPLSVGCVARRLPGHARLRLGAHGQRTPLTVGHVHGHEIGVREIARIGVAVKGENQFLAVRADVEQGGIRVAGRQMQLCAGKQVLHLATAGIDGVNMRRAPACEPVVPVTVVVVLHHRGLDLVVFLRLGALGLLCSCGKFRPDPGYKCEMAAIGEPAQSAHAGGHRAYSPCLATVCANQVQLWLFVRVLALATLGSEGNPLPVGRPLGIAIALAARELALCLAVDREQPELGAGFVLLHGIRRDGGAGPGTIRRNTAGAQPFE